MLFSWPPERGISQKINHLIKGVTELRNKNKEDNSRNKNSTSHEEKKLRGKEEQKQAIRRVTETCHPKTTCSLPFFLLDQ